jgi:hypothetical protein
LSAAFDHVRVGERVWLDDGKIGGSVSGNDGDLIELVVAQVPPAGARLRAEKGINFPDTELGLGALTDKDADDLRETLIGTLQRVDERSEAEEEAETLALLSDPSHMQMSELELVRALQSDRDGGQEERY